jgi:enoyl-CoA hydratase
MSTCFDVSHDGAVAHLRFNRPDQRNTLTPAFWTELPGLIRSIDDEARARVIVISSTGPHFSAGLDLSVIEGGGMFRASTEPTEPTEPGRVRARLYQGIRTLHDTFAAIDEARVPVLAAIQGGCIGGAVSLAAACDLRFATREAFFLLAEVNIAITPDVGQLQRLPRVLPDALVREMAYRGTRLDAVRAESVGFVNALYDDHQTLLDEVSAIAAEIAAKSPLAVWGAKRAISYAREHTVADGLDQIALWQAGMYHRDESLTALTAKRDNTTPGFDDLLPST